MPRLTLFALWAIVITVTGDELEQQIGSAHQCMAFRITRGNVKSGMFPFPSLESAYIGFTLHFLCGSCPDILTTNNVSLYETLTSLRSLNFLYKKTNINIYNILSQRAQQIIGQRVWLTWKHWRIRLVLSYNFLFFFSNKFNENATINYVLVLSSLHFNVLYLTLSAALGPRPTGCF